MTNVWLGLDVRNPGQLDRDLMGGHVSTDIQQTGCGVIDLSISKIEKVCRKRAREVYSFYRDYKLSIKHISSNVKINGFVCFVVGNRTVKDEYLRTDLFTKEIFEDCGFEHITTEIRKLPNTRMPSKVSPTGKKGKTAPTMQKEYIVICKKLE